MEGSGTTNYATDKPSYAYSTATTEFDDALIQRGIVTHTQAIMAKGASLEEAQRLTQLKQQEQNQHLVPPVADDNLEKNENDEDDEGDDDDSLFDNDPDDEFMEKYRRERMAQLQQAQSERQQGRRFGEAVLIDRTQWTKEVNEASNGVWVVVCLTSSDTERTGRMEAAVKQLAQTMLSTKFVLIAAHQAIDGWPSENLPSLFLYRHGTMQKQLVRLPCDTSTDELRELLSPILAESETDC